MVMTMIVMLLKRIPQLQKCCLYSIVVGATVGLPNTLAQEVDFFETRIRPVLVKHCYECHSSALTEPKGGLRVDFRDGLRKGGESGAAVQPGRTQDSLLLEAMKYESFEMPPSGKLPQNIIVDFERWIQDGAADPRDAAPTPQDSADEAWQQLLNERSAWWSLQPPEPHSPPEFPSALPPDLHRWTHEPVDRFILKSLQDQNLSPAKPADAQVLLRRLSFVLTGLPPTPAARDLFLSEFSTDPERALHDLVQRLLQSPHFGERMARHWMDVVRYTDTYGYEWDIPARGSWEYRDYLIRAFNQDVPYDQLIQEHIAGDLLPDPRINQTHGVNESLIGPMFYHMGEHRHGSSLDFNGIHQEMINNKIDAFSKAFLGMTVACARCHNHKLDAVSQADYYALAGMFMTPRWTARSIDTPDKYAAQIAELRRLRSDIRTVLGKTWASDSSPLNSPAQLRQWALEHRDQVTSTALEDIAHPFQKLLTDIQWLTPRQLTATAADGSLLLLEADGVTLRTQGTPPDTDTHTVNFVSPPATVNTLKLDALIHGGTHGPGPGLTPHGNFVLSHIRVQVQPFSADGASGSEAASSVRDVAIRTARADYSQPNYPVTAALETSSKGWGVGLGGNVDRTAWFDFESPVSLPHGGRFVVTLDYRYGSQHVLGRFRLTPGGVERDAPDVQDSNAAVDHWRQMAETWSIENSSRQQRFNSSFTSLLDFDNAKAAAPEDAVSAALPQDWAWEGAGLKYGFVSTATPRISLEGSTAIDEFLALGLHTHALSSKLPGAIRLPAPEQFPAARVSLRLAGGEWSGWRSIPQNAFMTEGPAFFNPASGATWATFTGTPLKNGVTRVLSEITTASLNSNFPPRTGVARSGTTKLPDTDEGFRKRSWLSLTDAVAHAESATPPGSLAAFQDLYSDPAPDSVEQCWQRLTDWLNGAVHRWATHTSQPGDDQILNWMLTSGLLPNDTSILPDVADLVQQYRTVETRIDFARSANSMDERGVQPINYRLNVRGDVDNEGPEIPRGFLQVFDNHDLSPQSAVSGRLQLAQYLASERNPQAARVYVNRIWHWIFGQGLVATPNDFGKLGDQPSHPELLDWLAHRFVQDNWSTKQLIRRLVLSQTFRQAGTVSTIATERDPGNRLLHHFATRRLEAEAIRDALLAVSGRLDPQLYGPPVNPPRSSEDAAKRLFSGPLDSNGRRSIYLEMSIMDPPKFLVGFNLPDLKLPTGRRDITNAPAQALIMLNDPLVVQMASHWADQLLRDECDSVQQRITRMFVTALARPPSTAELQRWSVALSAFASDIPSDDQTQRLASEAALMSDQAAWAELAHAMFNSQEFIYYR